MKAWFFEWFYIIFTKIWVLNLNFQIWWNYKPSSEDIITKISWLKFSKARRTLREWKKEFRRLYYRRFWRNMRLRNRRSWLVCNKIRRTSRSCRKCSLMCLAWSSWKWKQGPSMRSSTAALRMPWKAQVVRNTLIRRISIYTGISIRYKRMFKLHWIRKYKSWSSAVLRDRRSRRRKGRKTQGRLKVPLTQIFCRIFPTKR